MIESETSLPSSDNSWCKEHDFWYTKFIRASIRHEIARESKDQSLMNIAMDQMELYKRRMDAVVPDEVKLERAKQKEQERQEAINEQ